MLPRFSTSCLRATSTAKMVWLAKPFMSPTPQKLTYRSLYQQGATNIKKPSLFWTQNNQLSKRIFTTSKTTLAPTQQKTQALEKIKTAAAPEIGGSAVDANKRNATDWAIIKQLMKYIWPKNDVGVKTRVVIALSLLLGGKVSFC
jgi:ATP-binding cassette subfamily B (MDR/TAP) protein 7